jgi:hypothetical protein
MGMGRLKSLPYLMTTMSSRPSHCSRISSGDDQFMARTNRQHTGKAVRRLYRTDKVMGHGGRDGYRCRVQGYMRTSESHNYQRCHRSEPVGWTGSRTGPGCASLQAEMESQHRKSSPKVQAMGWTLQDACHGTTTHWESTHWESQR